MPTNKGTIASMLVVARDGNISQTYQHVLSQIRGILNCSIEDANPVTLKYGQYKKFWQAIRDEHRYHKRLCSVAFIKRLIDISVSVLILRYRLNPVFFLFNDSMYTESIQRHSDYRKFDDTLRLIIDCRQHEFQALQAMLEQAYSQGQIYYGLHDSKDALMTCFVENTQQGGHLHFIDGGDGGLAMAARQLKAQLKHEAQK